MELMLEGKIITPIINKKTVFEVEGCRAVVYNPKRRYITKSHKERRIYPFSFTGYLGSITLTFYCQNRNQAMEKVKKLLKIDHIGRFWREGYGKVEWVRGNIGTRLRSQRRKKHGWVKIRKGLPHHFPDHVSRLIRYALLHDFVHTPRHKSKIYLEPNFTEIELLRQHHDSTGDPLIRAFQQYDRIAASMTRNIRSPRTNRYTWEAIGSVDFQTLAQELEDVEQNIWQLYRYVYASRDLANLNESLTHGHSSLRFHLLLVANLIVQDFLRGVL